MKQYSKVIDGKTVVEYGVNIGIPIDGITMYGLPESVLITNGWTLYEEDLNDLKSELIKAVKLYDESDDIKVFYLNNNPMWLDKVTRIGLYLRFESEVKNGLTETTLWHNDMSYNLTIDTAFQMLHALELYASKCHDNTCRHLKMISGLQTAEEVKNYNIKHGYPDKLYFKA
jgi:hypothetical protein